MSTAVPVPVAARRRSGVLVIDKGGGMTSFDVVALARRRLGVRRIGHAGTLDPAATGVLPILVGEATKLMPYLADQDKEYRAIVRLGLRTDTHDVGGRVLAEAPVPAFGRDEVEKVCRAFVGRIKQVPPMYSALHHQGQRLYELARQGRAVEREARDVHVQEIELLDLAPPRATLRVVCGKGTYIRVLAAELGEALGVGGVIEHLVRTRVGPFSLPDALASSDLGTAPAERVWSALRPPEAALAGWPGVTLGERAAAVFGHGQPAELEGQPIASGGLVRVHDPSGALLGVGELVMAGRRVQPVRVLHADHPGPGVLPA